MKRSNQMQKVTIAALMVLLPCLLNAQALSIGRGTNVVVQGDVKLVLNDASLLNDGSFTAGNSTILFTGNAVKSNAFIGGRSRTAFANLSIDKAFTQVQLEGDISVSGALTMSAGNLELNNRRLNLGSTGMITGENMNARITGLKGGVVMATAILNAPDNVNPGNLGVALSSPANLGLTVITRGHVQQVNSRGETGIDRYYEIQPSFNTPNVTLRFFYLEPELAGNNESRLVIWSLDNANSGWTIAGKETADAGANWIAKNNIGRLNRFTLGVADNNTLSGRFIKPGAGRTGMTSIQAYPNPARDRFTVALYSETEKEGSVSLQDHLGRVLERRQVQYIKGMNTLRWNIDKYAAGTYYVVFEESGLGNLRVVKQ